MDTIITLVLSVFLFVLLLFFTLCKPRCKHKWELIKEVYSPPSRQQGISVGGSVALNTYAKLECGYTTLVFQCKRCNALHREECLGKTSPSATVC
jgi:hypothetical protein